MLSLTQPRNGSPNLTLRGMIPGYYYYYYYKHNNNHHHHTFNTSIRPESPKETRSPGNDVLDKAVADERSTWPVVLVSMPFMDVSRPSIQLGLLKSLAIAYGFPARTFHANLKFAKQIGVDYYQLLAEHRGHMVGEWLFSPEAFPGAAPDPDSCMVEELADGLSYLGLPQDELREKLTHTRHIDVPSYLEMLVDEFPWGEAAVVGFSSTFQQNTASFALARRLKQRYPHIFTVFGGANFDGEMGPEFVRTVDCIDAAVIGEGDDSFPRLLSALAAGSGPSAVPGIACRRDGQVMLTPPQPPTDQLDGLPVPDYEEYFTLAENLGIISRAGHRKVWLPIETARGCWWGAKHHCTFCGLNAETMRFRSKSPRRVLDELAQQARQYRSFLFEAVNNILDPRYLQSLFPVLVESETDYEFFYEVKANLGREQLKLMAQAGVTSLQPGIESLSSHVLGLMRKGVGAAQNVQPAALVPVLRHRRLMESPVGVPRRDGGGLRRAGGGHTPPGAPAAAGGNQPDLARAVQPALHRAGRQPVPRPDARTQLPVRLPSWRRS